MIIRQVFTKVNLVVISIIIMSHLKCTNDYDSSNKVIRCMTRYHSLPLDFPEQYR